MTSEILRVRPEGVVPLEIWRQARDRGLGAAVDEVRARHPFDLVYVGGGGTLEAPVRDAAARALRRHRLAWSGSGRFVAERGGRELLRRAGHARGAVVDVGQTAVKVSIVEGDGAPARHVAEHAAGAAAETTVALAVRASGAARARALVLALPCELTDEGVAGECTFPGWEGDRGLVARILEAAGAAPEMVLLVNDAELAAVSARCDGIEAAPAALVLTLGFGPGAALLRC